ncbi:ABC transporter substrate-binding protein [Nonomuraea sp. PA05]|uniref:ABC transporter substrate-binding protein n=1 Tax=Nonomuraea sp. PA05 TaxID=2604466 RepID=UPI001651C93D|nr:ABC transporter substrate-binding protein [Nonomuraea sp. PA05]
MRLHTPGTAALAVLLLSTTACGGTDGEAGAAAEFTYWSMYKQDEVRAKIVQDAATAFTKETGIKVNVVFQGRENLKKLQPTLVGGNVGADLVDGAAFNVLNMLQATGNAADLSGVYAATIPGETRTVADVVPDTYERLITDGGAKYLVPVAVHSWQVFYDAKRHPELAEQPPRTFDELLAVAGELKRKGRTPLALDGDVAGYPPKWTATLLIRELGPGGLAKVLQDKSGAGFDDPRVLKAAAYMERLGKGSLWADGWDASKFPAIQQKWAQGESDLLFMGTWAPSETGEVAGEGFEYRSFPFPETESGFDSQETTLYGFAVPAKSRHAEQAGKFIAYFLNKKWMDRIPAEDKVLSARTDTTTPPELADTKKALGSATAAHFALDGVRGMGDWETKIFNPLSKEILSGRLTGAQFVARLKTETVEWWKVNA